MLIQRLFLFNCILCLFCGYKLFSSPWCKHISSFPSLFPVSHFPMWCFFLVFVFICFFHAGSFAQCLMTLIVCPIWEGFLKAWLWREAMLAGELHCQVTRGLIKQRTYGIIWRLSLWGLKFPQSRIIQFNWLPSIWKEGQGRCPGFYLLTCGVWLHSVWRPSLPVFHSTWCFASWVHPESGSQISCGQGVLQGE